MAPKSNGTQTTQNVWTVQVITLLCQDIILFGKWKKKCSDNQIHWQYLWNSSHKSQIENCFTFYLKFVCLYYQTINSNISTCCCHKNMWPTHPKWLQSSIDSSTGDKTKDGDTDDSKERRGRNVGGLLLRPFPLRPSEHRLLYILLVAESLSIITLHPRIWHKAEAVLCLHFAARNVQHGNFH